ncbi:hypothetical protein Tco_0579981, partial [Tanacetum coccineum]
VPSDEGAADAISTNQGQSAGTLDGAAALDTLY